MVALDVARSAQDQAMEPSEQQIDSSSGVVAGTGLQIDSSSQRQQPRPPPYKTKVSVRADLPAYLGKKRDAHVERSKRDAPPRLQDTLHEILVAREEAPDKDEWDSNQGVLRMIHDLEQQEVKQRGKAFSIPKGLSTYRRLTRLVVRNFDFLGYDEGHTVSHDEFKVSNRSPAELCRGFRLFITGTLMNNGPRDVEKVMKLCEWPVPSGWATSCTPTAVFNRSSRRSLRAPLLARMLRVRTDQVVLLPQKYDLVLWIKETPPDQWLYDHVAALMKRVIHDEVVRRMRLQRLASRDPNGAHVATVSHAPSTRVFAVLHLLKALCISERVFVHAFQNTCVPALVHFYQEF